jgi:hypothetical protein
MITPRGETFKNGLLNINGRFILTGIQYLSIKHKYMPTGKVPNAVNVPDVPPSDLNVHFDYPLDSTPFSIQQPPDVQRHPPSRGAGT